MKNIFFWLLRLIPAFILIQSTYFKLTGAPESIELFNTIGFGDSGRIALGLVELIAGILLLLPKYFRWGAFMTFGILAGAIFTHLFKIGIEFNGDGGTLFAMAVIGFTCAGILLFQERQFFFGILRTS